jgi:enoyl-CoA hydratase
MLDASRAYEIGLANRVCAAVDLQSTVHELANEIIKNAPQAQQQLLAAVQAGYEPNTDGFAAETEAFSVCFDSENFRQGVTAFLQKRSPKF